MICTGGKRVFPGEFCVGTSEEGITSEDVVQPSHLSSSMASHSLAAQFSLSLTPFTHSLSYCSH